MIFTSISGVGGSSLAEELKLLGPRYTAGVLVTQVVPAVSGYSSAVLEYKNALAKYFPGEAPDYASLEGFVAANILIDAIKRAGPQFDTEKLVDTLEAPAISIWASACRSISAAPNTPPRKRSGARRSTRAAVSSRSTWNSRRAGQRLSMTRLCTARPK